MQRSIDCEVYKNSLLEVHFPPTFLFIAARLPSTLGTGKYFKTCVSWLGWTQQCNIHESYSTVTARKSHNRRHPLMVWHGTGQKI